MYIVFLFIVEILPSSTVQSLTREME
jgi:hypothetical protein